MYPNLRAEMTRHNISTQEMAQRIGISDRTLRNKLVGTSDFSLSEITKIKQGCFPNFTFEYLFSQDIENLL